MFTLLLPFRHETWAVSEHGGREYEDESFVARIDGLVPVRGSSSFVNRALMPSVTFSFFSAATACTSSMMDDEVLRRGFGLVQENDVLHYDYLGR